MNASRLTLAALLALALLPASASAQKPLLPPEVLLAQAQPPLQPPESLPQDEDDEELGEEIPDDGEADPEPEPDEPAGPDGDSGSSGGGGSPTGPQDPPAGPRAAGLPRTGGDPVPPLVLGTLLLTSGIALRARTR